MDKKDLEQIRQIVKEETTSVVNTALSEFWESNLEPAFDVLNERLDVVETKLDKALYAEVVHLEARIKRLEEKVGITHQHSK
ncbi:MAG: hypothetical protein A3A83_00685 [Candidatus Doudnabacteria bacterium RIFCSPLOWO2_01_FULL_48_57]|nr:MAG: hypothetical protein A3K05_02295 [Candidatus Doudnabacteria bacterium RIFCSPHIGHO2_01_48_18]OGE98134.1 MAG: hypothetical protein A3A83_00685 [Candidatus Doudnabacteria bacterium RIFCSPLOWO2_01_FULL_48_57]